MSRLIDIDPHIQQDAEPAGYKFGYYTFDTLPTMEVSNIDIMQDTLSSNEKDFNENLAKLPLTDEILLNFQLQDTFCANILAQIEKGNIIQGHECFLFSSYFILSSGMLNSMLHIKSIINC